MATAATIVKSKTLSLAEQIEYRREALKNRNFIPIGCVLMVRLGVDDNAAYFQQEVNNKIASITQRQGLTLDWQKHDAPQLAQVGKDMDSYVFPRGISMLPKIKDPRIASAVAPMIPQNLDHYASGYVAGRDGSKFYVLQPVEQVVVLMYAASTMLIMHGRTNPMNGTKCAMLISPKGGEGYIVGGLLSFD